MKRHEALQPLSRQHHSGLLISLLLNKGIKKNAPLGVMSNFICDCWTKELNDHFELEETVLLPALTNKPFPVILTEQLLEEHQQIRLLAENACNHSAMEKDIIDFASLLEKHIRFEEKVFFPKVELVLSEVSLNEIALLLKDSVVSNCINYPVKFWE
ncbi:MAG: hemerythrin domain-containing protein [Chitinophagaceae bacterium]